MKDSRGYGTQLTKLILKYTQKEERDRDSPLIEAFFWDKIAFPGSVSTLY